METKIYDQHWPVEPKIRRLFRKRSRLVQMKTIEDHLCFTVLIIIESIPKYRYVGVDVDIWLVEAEIRAGK